MTTETAKINIDRDGGTWFAAIWVGGEYDTCVELPCDDDASDDEAEQCAMDMPLLFTGPREVCRVDDAAVQREKNGPWK